MQISVTYTWDNNGNLLNDGSALYRYDPANRLISTTLGGATSLFNYTGDGARLKQVVNSVVTTYTQDLAASLPVVLQAKTGVTTTKYLYTLGTRPLAQNTTAWEYLLPDALGSVRQIVDANGNVTLVKSYEPYGSVLTSTGTASSIFGYSDEVADTYIKLVFLRTRYYSPETARFLSKDVWQGDYTRPQSFNAWAYTEGNPINRVDPSGRFSAVAIANAFFNGPTLVGYDRVEGAFESLSRHLGWLSLLLDADESQYIYNWSNLTHREPYGRIKCSEDGHSITRANEPYTGWRTAVDLTLNNIPRPRPDLGRWWRDNGVYSLVNGSEEKFYFDKGDDGHTNDLPDFMILTGGSVGKVVNGTAAAIQDRYGRVYGQAGISLSPPLPIPSIFLGEGYVYHGSIWDIQSRDYLSEDKLAGAIKFAAASLDAALLFGSTININACPALWDIGPCYGSLIFTTGLQFDLSIGGNTTLGPTAVKPDEAWDWMLSESGPSRAEVWQQWIKSAVDNPCGECSAAK